MRIAVLFGCLTACEDPNLVARSTGVEPKYLYSDERVCDVTMKRIKEFAFWIPYPYNKATRELRMVVCLKSAQSEVPRESCREWLLRRMSLQKETEFYEGLGMQETDRSDAAKWKIAYLAAENSIEFEKRNPPPHTYENPHELPHWIKVIRRQLGDEAAKPNKEKEMREEAQRRSRFREAWNTEIKEKWRNVIPSGHCDAEEIATLQQRIAAIDLGLCPYCCIRFAVTYNSAEQHKRFVDYLRRNSTVWFADVGDFCFGYRGSIGHCVSSGYFRHDRFTSE
ncbi:MAG: hypothetical protein RBU30_08405 [Polyangia bacterium]|nr:hypothetical protein [Polyangia bacterium]